MTVVAAYHAVGLRVHRRRIRELQGWRRDSLLASTSTSRGYSQLTPSMPLFSLIEISLQVYTKPRITVGLGPCSIRMWGAASTNCTPRVVSIACTHCVDLTMHRMGRVLSVGHNPLFLETLLFLLQQLPNMALIHAFRSKMRFGS